MKDLNDNTAMSDVQKSVDSLKLSLSDEQNTAFFRQADRLNTGAPKLIFIKEKIKYHNKRKQFHLTKSG